MSLTLRQLSYFVALAETRHFGRAAARVHVTQPALSVQIREMEARLGTTLILRDGMRLTPAGQEVLVGARRVLAEVGRLEQAARWRGGLQGRLNLGVIPTVAPYLLARVLPLLAARHGGVELRLREATTELLLADLDDGRLDAAVVALPAGAPGLEERALFQDRFLLAGAAADMARLAADHAALTPTGLDPEHLLLLDEGHCLADQALEVCGLARDETRVDLGAASLATLCRLVAQGFGRTFVPEIAVASERAAAPGLVVMRFDAPEPGRVIGLVRRAHGGPDGWFEDLAALLREAGEAALALARDT